MAGERTLDDVAAQLEKNKARGRSCALLIGAGCSVQAGIPLARGFVEEIRKRYPGDYEHAAEKIYPHCMAELSGADRHDLICEFIDKAKINWAHISIAQLMKGGYVDRVLTTNFDPLVMRACALVNLFPAVYDMAVVRDGFLSDFVRDRAIFHLHGQRDGFVQLHKEDDVEALAKVIQPLFDDTAHDRTWLVIGYSGSNDPVFRVIAARPNFPNRLFWIGYRSEAPSPAVKKALLEANKDAYWISNHDPDNFLVQLAAKLACFPPGFFARPFSHLLESYATLAGFRLPDQEVDLDWAARARGWIQAAISRFEDVVAAEAVKAAGGGASPGQPSGQPPGQPLAPPAPAAAPAAPPLTAPAVPPPTAEAAAAAVAGLESLTSLEPSPAPPGTREATGDVVGAAWTALITGDYDKVLALRSAGTPAMDGLVEPTAGAYFGRAKSLSRLAQTKSGDEADALFQQAIDTFGAALKIKPKDASTLSNLGNTLFRHAKIKEGAAAEALLAKAEATLAEAEAIRPGVAAYRLSRLAAFRGDQQTCLAWLEVAAKRDMLPARAYMEDDPDLSGVHDNPHFKAFLDRIEPTVPH